MTEPVKLDLIHPTANLRIHVPEDPVFFPRTEKEKHGKLFSVLHANKPSSARACHEHVYKTQTDSIFFTLIGLFLDRILEMR